MNAPPRTVGMTPRPPSESSPPNRPSPIVGPMTVSTLDRATLADHDTTVDPRPIFYSGCGVDAVAGHLYDGATLLAQAPLIGGPGGAWSYQPASPLPNGTYNVSLTCVDAAGNESAPTSTFTFTIHAL
jgi:hypothetical protein